MPGQPAKVNKKVQKEDILQSMHKSLQQSGDLLKNLSQQKPVSGNTAFANYVRDSLLGMNKKKLRNARLAINKVLTEMMDEYSGANAPRTLSAQLPSMSS